MSAERPPEMEALAKVLESHTLLPFAKCTCGAEHDRRGTGESGYSWYARHVAAVLASDWLADHDARVCAEALREAALDLDVPVRGTIDGVRVVRLIDVTAWLRDEATRVEADR